MGATGDAAGPPDIGMLELLEEAMKLVRAGLQEGRPGGAAREAALLYANTDDPSHKTDATKAAFLSNWPDFARHLEESGREAGSMSKEDVTALFVHQTYLRMRRKKYRDDQMGGQVGRANARDRSGEPIPFDPADPKARENCLKDLRDVIATILETRTPRDRLVIELRYYEELLPKTIVEVVQKALPGEPISEPTISRILKHFEDDLRDSLSEE